MDEIKLPVVEATAIDIRTSGYIRNVCKWVLDLLRNIIIVGVLQFMAVKTANVWVRSASWISYAALFGYCGSYIQMWSARADVGRTLKVRLSVFIAVSVVLAIASGLYFLYCTTWLRKSRRLNPNNVRGIRGIGGITGAAWRA